MRKEYIKAIFALAVLGAVGGSLLYARAEAPKAIEEAGYAHVDVLPGASPRECGWFGAYGAHFLAVDKTTNKVVTGVVCTSMTQKTSLKTVKPFPG